MVLRLPSVEKEVVFVESPISFNVQPGRISQCRKVKVSVSVTRDPLNFYLTFEDDDTGWMKLQPGAPQDGSDYFFQCEFDSEFYVGKDYGFFCSLETYESETDFYLFGLLEPDADFGPPQLNNYRFYIEVSKQEV